MRFLCVRPEVCPRVSRFPESGFLQISSHDEHPCLRLCPSHYRADSGLAPARNVRRRAHASTTSPAGGLLLSPFQGIIAFPPKGGLRNRSICYWWPLKSGLQHFSLFSGSPSSRSLSYCSAIYFVIVASFTIDCCWLLSSAARLSSRTCSGDQ